MCKQNPCLLKAICTSYETAETLLIQVPRAGIKAATAQIHKPHGQGMTASQERRVCNNSLIQRFLLPPFFEMFESKGGGNSMSPRKTGNCIKYNNQRDAGE